MDIHWTVPNLVEDYVEYDTQDGNDDKTSSSSSLLCIDNCLHPKETATGARAVAKALGLDKYLQGDAYEMDLFLEPNSIDVLWCDFGVGSNMADFCSKGGAWSSITPGGFLICHSALTNQGTRDWLEGIREGKSQSMTGIPSDEYVESSLLEPHQYFQNSITILQKWKQGKRGSSFCNAKEEQDGNSHEEEDDDDVYKEPIYSQYA